jgi:hypothetical protein
METIGSADEIMVFMVQSLLACTMPTEFRNSGGPAGPGRGTVAQLVGTLEKSNLCVPPFL